jgi:hypothetical protein
MLSVQNLFQRLACDISPQHSRRWQDDGGGDKVEDDFDTDLLHGTDLALKMLRQSSSEPFAISDH